MSSKKINRSNFVNFQEAWIRVLSTTKIKNYKQLAEIVGVSGSAVTTRAQKNEFPLEWGFLVAQEFGLNTDWLLTGEGEAKKGEIKEEDKILLEVISWVKENSRKNESFKFWFIYELEQKFPDFKEWRRGKEQSAGKDVLDLFKPISQNDSK